MKRLIVISAIIASSMQLVHSQNEVDALRYTQTTPFGTSRFVAMGGALGALGADFSTLSTNPAGMGLFKSSEFTISSAFYIGRTESEYTGSPSRNDYKYNFNFPSVGLVYTFFERGKFVEKPGWRNVQFGFGINRLANFNNRAIIEGFNDKNSLITSYIEQAKGIKYTNLDNFSTGLAYDTYLMDPTGVDSNQYVSFLSNGGVLQRKTIQTNGSINEVVLSLAGNYSDKLYVGGTLGFPFIRYNETSRYTESDRDNVFNDFNSYTLREELSTTGAGINLKIGMIYKPVEFLRFGLAFHTPTVYYNMEDTWNKRIDANFNSMPNLYSQSPTGNYTYELTTPMKVMGSVGFLFGKMGAIGVDYEFVDNSESRLRSDDYDYYNENNAIQDNYTSSSNIRIGTEWKLEPISFRAGYSIYGSPYQTGINDGKKTVMSFGIGYREKTYYIDCAYSYSKANEDYYLYSGVGNPVKNTITGSNFMMTLGFKF